MSRALPGDLECRELVELVTDHLDGALPVAERTRLELHLASCPACATYVRQLRAALGGAARVAREPVPEDVRDELLAAFRGWRRRTAPP